MKEKGGREGKKVKESDESIGSSAPILHWQSGKKQKQNEKIGYRHRLVFTFHW